MPREIAGQEHEVPSAVGKFNEGHDGAKYVLTGPETLTQREQVRLIGEAIGRTLRVEEQSPNEVREQFRWGDAAYADATLSYWATLVDNPEPVTTTVADVTGAPAHPSASGRPTTPTTSAC